MLPSSDSLSGAPKKDLHQSPEPDTMALVVVWCGLSGRLELEIDRRDCSSRRFVFCPSISWPSFDVGTGLAGLTHSVVIPDLMRYLAPPQSRVSFAAKQTRLSLDPSRANPSTKTISPLAWPPSLCGLVEHPTVAWPGRAGRDSTALIPTIAAGIGREGRAVPVRRRRKLLCLLSAAGHLAFRRRAGTL